MDYMFPSRNHEHINDLNQEEEPPLFLHFLSPFLDDMDTTTILPKHHHISTDICTTTTINTATTNQRLASKLKCVRKKRSAGKKDRHSKIHTAQGLRDRRMRLSVHTARKFFDLNDMLGFDKASKTIEWLFSKSKEAIDEVTETLQSDKENNVIESSLSACETESVMEINKDENLEIQGDQIEDENSRKKIESYPLVSESRNKAREGETERTRDNMMLMQYLKKPKQLFQELGCSGNSDNHKMEESSCYPLDFSNTYHFLKHLQLDNTVRNPDTYLENIAANSSTNCSIYDYNKTIVERPTGWLNSRNTFLGFFGGWNSENSRMESNNGIVPCIGPLTNSIIGENHNSGLISSNFVNFHSQNEGQ